MEDLKHEYDSLTQEIGRLQDALDTLVRMQRKYVDIFLMWPHILFSSNCAKLIFFPLISSGTGFLIAYKKLAFFKNIFVKIAL